MYAGKLGPGPSCKSGSPEPPSSPVPSPTIQAEGGTQSGTSEGGKRNSGPCPNSLVHALDFQSLLPTRVLVKTRAAPSSPLLLQGPRFQSRTIPYMPWGGRVGVSLATSVQPGVFQMKPTALAWPGPALPCRFSQARAPTPFRSLPLSSGLAHVPGPRAQGRALQGRLPLAPTCCPHGPPGTDAKPAVPRSTPSLAGTQAP